MNPEFTMAPVFKTGGREPSSPSNVRWKRAGITPEVFHSGFNGILNPD